MSDTEHYKGKVANGCSQCAGIDYNDTYSPTFHAATLRTALAAARIEDMELCSVCVSAAFTTKNLKEVICMHQPERFHEGSSTVVCRLEKSLYELKQAAKQWNNKKLHFVLLELGFTHLQSDWLVYIYAKGEVHIIMLVYIDDITLASKNC
ncbi:hypothetical protein H1R20_g16012, partial [Candolleomyces eurysporus]